MATDASILANARNPASSLAFPAAKGVYQVAGRPGPTPAPTPAPTGATAAPGFVLQGVTSGINRPAPSAAPGLPIPGGPTMYDPGPNPLPKPIPSGGPVPTPAPVAGAPGATPAPAPAAGGIVAGVQSGVTHPVPAPGQPGAAPGQPAQWDVSGDQTVAGNIASLIDPNSPLIQQARARAVQDAAARGMLNSSMASTGADAAAYATALPIAEQDAQTRAQAAQFNAGQKNTYKLTEDQIAEQKYGVDVGSRTALQQARIQAESAKYGVDMSSMTSKQIADIQAATSRYGVDVASRTDLQRAAIASDSAKYGVDIGSMTALQQSAIAAASQKSVAQIGADSAWATANLSADTQKAVAGMNTQSQQLIAAINADTNKYIAGLDSQTKEQVTQWTNQNQLLLNTNSNATSAFNQAMANVQAIQNNGAMDEATKTAAIDSIFGSLNAQFKIIGSVSGLNLGDILSGAGGAPPAATPAPAPAPAAVTQ